MIPFTIIIIMAWAEFAVYRRECVPISHLTSQFGGKVLIWEPSWNLVLCCQRLVIANSLRSWSVACSYVESNKYLDKPSSIFHKQTQDKFSWACSNIWVWLVLQEWFGLGLLIPDFNHTAWKSSTSISKWGAFFMLHKEGECWIYICIYIYTHIHGLQFCYDLNGIHGR